MPLQTAERALLHERRHLTRAEALAVAHLPLDELPSLIALAHKVRLAWCGPEVELESLINAKSGACPEDCAFCSQSVRYQSGVDVYPFLDDRRDPRRGARHPRGRRDAVLHRRRGPRARGAAAPEGHRRGRRRATRDRPRGRVLARAARRRTSRPARGGGRAPLQPQPRSVPRGVPVDLHDAQLRRPRRRRRAARATPAWSCAAAASSAWARRSSSASTSRSSSPSSNRARCRSTCSTRVRARRSTTTPTLSPREALQAIALFRLILPGAWLRLAGGRERVLGELQAMGLLAGANALIVGNYLTTTGRAPEEDHALLEALGMPVADGPGEGRFVVDATGAHARPARRSIPRHRGLIVRRGLVERGEVRRSVAPAGRSA